MVLTAMGIHESTALRYYRLALKAVSTLLVHPVYAHSDEVLAACIILSTYDPNAFHCCRTLNLHKGTR